MWATLKANTEAIVHVYPIEDTREHELEGEECGCGPRVEDVIDDDGNYRGKIIIHRAYDGREKPERQAFFRGKTYRFNKG